MLTAVRTFVSEGHKGGVIEIYEDNTVSISSYSSGRARDTVLAACCRAMWFKAAATQTRLIFAHLPRESMVLPDALSQAHAAPGLRAKAEAIIKGASMSEVAVNAAAYSHTSFMLFQTPLRWASRRTQDADNVRPMSSPASISNAISHIRTFSSMSGLQVRPLYHNRVLLHHHSSHAYSTGVSHT